MFSFLSSISGANFDEQKKITYTIDKLTKFLNNQDCSEDKKGEIQEFIEQCQALKSLKGLCKLLQIKTEKNKNNKFDEVINLLDKTFVKLKPNIISEQNKLQIKICNAILQVKGCKKYTSRRWETNKVTALINNFAMLNLLHSDEIKIDKKNFSKYLKIANDFFTTCGYQELKIFNNQYGIIFLKKLSKILGGQNNKNGKKKNNNSKFKNNGENAGSYSKLFANMIIAFRRAFAEIIKKINKLQEVKTELNTWYKEVAQLLIKQQRLKINDATQGLNNCILKLCGDSIFVKDEKIKLVDIYNNIIFILKEDIVGRLLTSGLIQSKKFIFNKEIGKDNFLYFNKFLNLLNACKMLTLKNYENIVDFLQNKIINLFDDKMELQVIKDLYKNICFLYIYKLIEEKQIQKLLELIHRGYVMQCEIKEQDGFKKTDIRQYKEIIEWMHESCFDKNCNNIFAKWLKEQKNKFDKWLFDISSSNVIVNNIVKQRINKTLSDYANSIYIKLKSHYNQVISSKGKIVEIAKAKEILISIFNCNGVIYEYKNNLNIYQAVISAFRNKEIKSENLAEYIWLLGTFNKVNNWSIKDYTVVVNFFANNKITLNNEDDVLDLKEELQKFSKKYLTYLLKQKQYHILRKLYDRRYVLQLTAKNGLLGRFNFTIYNNEKIYNFVLEKTKIIEELQGYYLPSRGIKPNKTNHEINHAETLINKWLQKPIVRNFLIHVIDINNLLQPYFMHILQVISHQKNRQFHTKARGQFLNYLFARKAFVKYKVIKEKDNEQTITYKEKIYFEHLRDSEINEENIKLHKNLLNALKIFIEDESSDSNSHTSIISICSKARDFFAKKIVQKNAIQINNYNALKKAATDFVEKYFEFLLQYNRHDKLNELMNPKDNNDGILQFKIKNSKKKAKIEKIYPPKDIYDYLIVREKPLRKLTNILKNKSKLKFFEVIQKLNEWRARPIINKSLMLQENFKNSYGNVLSSLAEQLTRLQTETLNCLDQQLQVIKHNEPVNKTKKQITEYCEFIQNFAIVPRVKPQKIEVELKVLGIYYYCLAKHIHKYYQQKGFDKDDAKNLIRDSEKLRVFKPFLRDNFIDKNSDLLVSISNIKKQKFDELIKDKINTLEPLKLLTIFTFMRIDEYKKNLLAKAKNKKIKKANKIIQIIEKFYKEIHENYKNVDISTKNAIEKLKELKFKNLKKITIYEILCQAKQQILYVKNSSEKIKFIIGGESYSALQKELRQKGNYFHTIKILNFENEENKIEPMVKINLKSNNAEIEFAKILCKFLNCQKNKQASLKINDNIYVQLNKIKLLANEFPELLEKVVEKIKSMAQQGKFNVNVLAKHLPEYAEFKKLYEFVKSMNNKRRNNSNSVTTSRKILQNAKKKDDTLTIISKKYSSYQKIYKEYCNAMQKLINRCNQINNSGNIKKKKNGFSFFKKKNKSQNKDNANTPESIEKFCVEANKDFTFITSSWSDDKKSSKNLTHKI